MATAPDYHFVKLEKEIHLRMRPPCYYHVLLTGAAV